MSRALNITLIAGILIAVTMVYASPMIVRGVENFKTFLELRTLLNPCDGVGSPPPCHDNRR